MIAASPQPSGWAQRRWLVTVLLVFTAQLGLIFGLSDKPRPRARPSGAAPMLRLIAPGSSEVLALMDPTWFALPHRQGFSGPAWMTMPGFPARAFSWSEELRPLGLRTQDLGAAFSRFVGTKIRLQKIDDTGHEGRHFEGVEIQNKLPLISGAYVCFKLAE